MIFIETARFSAARSALLTDDEYIDLQVYLIDNPRAGVVIQGGGGLRKVRWASQAKGGGKSGGVRVIYLYIVTPEQITLADIYAKNRKADLSKKELKDLKKKLS